MILEVKVGEKVDAGAVLCRLYYTKEDHVEEAADMVEDAFRISSHDARRTRADSGSRRLIRSMDRFTGLLGIRRRFWVLPGCSRATSARSSLRIIFWGLGLQFAFAFLVLKTDFGKLFPGHRRAA